MHVITSVLFFAVITTGETLSSPYHGPTALPEVLHNGYLADTHEVAAAKSAHLATLSHQSHGGSYGTHGDSHHNQHGYQGDSRYHGPIAIPHVLHDGHIADTHEVAAAKAEHFAAVAKARAHAGYAHGEDYSGQYEQHSEAPVAHVGYGNYASYQGLLAEPVVLPSGYLADTVEVAHAKQQHYHLVHSSQSKHLY